MANREKKESRLPDVEPWINSHKPRATEPAKVIYMSYGKEPGPTSDEQVKIGWRTKALGIAALVVAAFGLGMWLCNGYIIPPPPVKVQPRQSVYIVKPGDTLWEIAAQNSDNTQDIRAVYYKIMVDNGLGHNENILPGQKLIIKY